MKYKPTVKTLGYGTRVVIAMCALSLTAVTGRAQAPRDALTREMERAASTFPGFCTAIVDADSTRFRQAMGYADLAARRAYTDSTVQPVGSITKTLIGMLLAKAAQDGTVNLDAPISERLPFRIDDPRGAATPITWRQLATHTSGLRDREDGYRAAYVTAASADTAFGAYLRSYFTRAGALYHADHFARERPGQRFAYTNVGAALAAFGLEQVRGASFASLVEREIFTPLGMQHSRLQAQPARTQDAVLYDADRRVVAPYTLVTYPDGGLRTSCADLARLLRGVLSAERGGDSRLMSQSAARLMLSPQFTADAMPKDVEAREPNQGLFWQFRRNGGVGHSGSDPGVTAFVLIDPKRGTGRLFMTNVDFGEGKTSERYAAAFSTLWSALAQYESTLGAGASGGAGR